MFNKKYKDKIKELESQNQQLNDKLSKQSIQLDIEKSTNKELTELVNKLQEKYRDEIELDKIKSRISVKKDELSNIENRIIDAKNELNFIQKELVQSYKRHDIQTMGLYEPILPKYSTEEYKQKISEIRKKRGTMLSNKEYYLTKSQWTYNGSVIQGQKLLNFFTKQSITAFNLSVDALIDRITISNVRDLKDRIVKIFNNINTELNKHEIFLNNEYLNLILQELEYKYELELKKQQDKEEYEHQKALIKEQEATEKELKKQHDQLLKERAKFTLQLEQGANVQDKIDEINKAIENNEYKKEHTLAGYVYIISNPSLGKDVYKIGVTRRANWEHRIDELSNASVPFRFSPNCILFSENAFALETALHKEFDKYRVNKINKHKEYFKLPLEEIEKIIKSKYDKDAIFDYNIVDENWLLSKSTKLS